MRVALFSDIYLPRIGGTTVSVVNTAAALREAGARPFLFVPFSPEAAGEDDVVFFPTMRLPLGGTTIRTAAPWFAPRVSTRFAAADVDVVHSFSPFFVGTFARHLARRHGLPVVFTYQTRYSAYLHFLPFGRHLLAVPPLRRLLHASVRRLTARVCNAYTCVIVPTATMAALLRRFGVHRPIAVIPVGFATAALRPPAPPVRPGLPPGAFTLLHVGRLSAEKNVRFLIRAFARAVAAGGRPLHLVVVGDGPERGPLERLAGALGVAERVTFVGPVPHERIGPYYQAADAFAFSSLSDTQAFVISEALIAGLPVVAVRAPGPADFAADGREGLLTALDEGAFAGALRRVAGDPALRAALAAGALAKGDDLSRERYTRRLLALYTRLHERTL